MARRKKTDQAAAAPLAVEFDADGRVVGDEAASVEPHPMVAELGESYRSLSAWNEARPDTERLPVRLTEEEVRQLGILVANDVERLEVMKEDNASIKKGLKASEEALQRKISEHSRVVRKGVEIRDVQVARVADLDRCVARLLRLDTGEFVEGRDRPLSTHEIEELRQQKLPGV